MAKSSLGRILPVLFGFFVMGFCDVVGIATSYVKQDFSLSETVAGFIPSMVFVWFLLLSIPAAVWMNRIGRKRMVQLSNVVTFVGMLIPFVHYSFATCMAGFVLLGVGNTILQVSLNPLLTNVVSGSRLTSMLTAGQVIKAVSSFCGPFIAAFALGVLGEWRYLFPIFAGITFLSMLWLMLTEIPKETSVSGTSSLGATFSILKDRTILLLFLGIFFVVGVDVGTNTVAPKLLIEREGLSVDQAGIGSSLYFVCRTAGGFDNGPDRMYRLLLFKHILGNLFTGDEEQAGQGQRDFGPDDNGCLRRGCDTSGDGGAYGRDRKSDRLDNRHRRLHGLPCVLCLPAPQGRGLTVFIPLPSLCPVPVPSPGRALLPSGVPRPGT